MTLHQSPAHTKGRAGATPDRIVIHWFGMGKLAQADAHFTRPDANTSAHFGIEDDQVVQWVDEKDTAWHAGNLAMNHRSFGIEHSAEPGRDASEQTIQSSAKLVARLSKDWNIPIDRSHIIKHSEVKSTQCPGTIPIDRIIEIAKSINSPGFPDSSKNTGNPGKGDTMTDRDYRNMYYNALDSIIKLTSPLTLPIVEGWADSKDKLDQQVIQLKDRVLQRLVDLENVSEQRSTANSQVIALTMELEESKKLNKTITEQLKEKPEPILGALAHITEALKAAMKGQW